ncbi:MAG: carbamoyltransferase HypF [Desulfobacterales bacterium]|nr:carbamoyltransferase HypF [Desulfobacterales bacterium]
MADSRVARQLLVNGVVQGVGFRPFIFGLAHEHALNGEVSNTSQGVDIRVEGPKGAVDAFVRDISSKTPPLARITRVEVLEIPPRDRTGFKIIPSQTQGSRATLISPDVSICEDCRREMLDPKNRRHHYPFINCTHCGPRFTIIKDLPYDRPQTSMVDFPMCPDCRAEYEDPLDRRFHAQPNACPVCGPRVWLTDSRGKILEAHPHRALDRAAQALSRGEILAVKGLGGFHLACDAANGAAVAELRRRKQRPHKPFALMARSLEDLEDWVRVSPEEAELLSSMHKPIVLLDKKDSPGSIPLSGLAPDNACLGIMLPYTPLHVLLLEKGPPILVMTSGNRPGDPLSVDNEDALDAFGHIAHAFLLHDRDIYFGADDSIVRVQAGASRFIRRSRGYAPLPLLLEGEFPPILGCGAHLKNTVCLSRGNQLFLSQHMGNLENEKVHGYFRRSIDHMADILEISPRIIAHDLHGDYYSSAYARERIRENPELERVEIQHHHAHAVSCMAENGLIGWDSPPVIAVVLDGTGLGSDGTIWGGEILTCTPGDFKRRAHLAPLPMPGGDAAAREPWRMAAALLFHALGRDMFDLDFPWPRDVDQTQVEFLVQMMEKQLNCPPTSGCGRYFDGVASILGLCHVNSHEAQAAMVVEHCARAAQAPLDLTVDLVRRPSAHACEHDPWVLDFSPGIRDMVSVLSRGDAALADLAQGFQAGLVYGISRAVERIREETGLERVVLSGGVFHNDFMLSALTRSLASCGLDVFSHSRVPTGDGGISLGQVVAASAMIENREKGVSHVP